MVLSEGFPGYRQQVEDMVSLGKDLTTRWTEGDCDGLVCLTLADVAVCVYNPFSC